VPSMSVRGTSPSLRGLGGRTALSLGLGILTAVAGVGVLSTSGYLLSLAAERPPVLKLMIAVVGVQVFSFTRAGSRYAERLTTHDVALRALARVRAWFVACLEPLAPGGLIAFREGDLLQRLAGDADELLDLLPRVLAPAVVAAGTSLVMLILAGLLDWRSALVLGAGFLAAGSAVPLIAARAARGLDERRAVLRARLATQLVDLRAMAPEIAAFGREAAVRGELHATEAALHRAEQRVALVAGLGDALSLALSVITMALTALVAVAAVRDGRLAGVAIASLVLAIPAAFEPIQALPAAMERWDAVRTAWRRVAGAARTPAPVADPENPVQAPASTTLTTDDVWTGYAGDRSVLRGVDLEVWPGARVAIVGPSGAGKTTLASALVRFLSLSRGSVRLGDVETARLPQHDVRARVCLVAQDAHLFAGSIRANLMLARPEAGEEDLVAALRGASLWDWVQTLPAGLDTAVGELGSRISGGQRRRLALARGYLAAPPILVLDEPGAHLDARTADATTRHLLGPQGPPTLLLITHRLAGLEEADRVLVLEEGRMVERGAPSELLARPSRLRALRELEQGPSVYERPSRGAF
jgi:ATP-binding cassette, subfamily C, bacterial CydCD